MKAPAQGPVVSVVVVNFERPEMTRSCLDHVERAIAHAGVRVETIIVDNGSGDESVAILRRTTPWASVVAIPVNRGLPAALNRGWEASRGEWVLMLNNDVLLDARAVVEALAVAVAAADVGTVAVELRFADRPGVINSAGIGVDRLGVPFDLEIGRAVQSDRPAGPTEVFGACGAAALYRREMLEGLGGFDESFEFGFEDVDLSWRAQMRGWRTLLVPAAVALHAHGGTVSAGSPVRAYQAGLNRVRLLAKHATGPQLKRYGLVMVAYDMAYVVYALARLRTVAPLAGRLRGLCEWRRYRVAAEPERRPVALAPIQGLRAALGRRKAWATADAPPATAGR